MDARGSGVAAEGSWACGGPSRQILGTVRTVGCAWGFGGPERDILAPSVLRAAGVLDRGLIIRQGSWSELAAARATSGGILINCLGLSELSFSQLLGASPR